MTSSSPTRAVRRRIPVFAATRRSFSALADRALALGFDAVATGHYARLSDGRLTRAVDRDKDQSHVLGVLTGTTELCPVPDRGHA